MKKLHRIRHLIPSPVFCSVHFAVKSVRLQVMGSLGGVWVLSVGGRGGGAGGLGV